MEVVLAETTSSSSKECKDTHASCQGPIVFQEDNALMEIDFETILALDFDPEVFSTMFLNDPTGTMDSFL